VPPIMQETTKLSPYSFQANWKKVFDAVGYYVTVYTKDGKTTETENFTDFNIIAKSGWNQTFYTTTNVSVPSAPCAVLFTNPEDTLYSSYYPEAVTEIKFWVRSEDKQRESQFFIEGLTKDNVWDTVATLPITLGLTGNTKTYSLDAEKGFRRFRFSVDEMISKKGLVFDDFSATHNAKVIMNRYLVESPYIVNGLDSLRVMSLVPNTEYICKVQATDQDDQVRYENVTDYSVVEVTTIDGTDADSRKLSVSIGSDGSILVSINDADLKDSKGNPLDLYVFSVTGQLVRHFPYSSFKENPGQIVISGLLINNTYIISLGAKRKSKFAKVFVK